MSQQTATLPQLTDRQKRLLWLSYRYPQLLRDFERDELAKLDGLAAAARDVIAAGQTAVLAERDPFVAAIVDDVLRQPAYTAQQIHRRRELAGEIESEERKIAAADLARLIFQDETAVMVAAFSHFSGSYPQVKHERTCETYWVAAGVGNQVKSFAPVRFTLWRPYQMKGGDVVVACPHCQHERVLDFCQKIEKASELYTYSLDMRYTIQPTKEATKLMEKIKKRNQRGAFINAVTFPLEGGKTAVLHDATDIEGEELPSDRAALYDLVKSWVLATPKGKRAGHGLGTWGRSSAPKEQKQDGAETAVSAKEDKSPTGKHWRLIGRNFGQVAMKLSAWLEEDVTVKGAKLALDVGEFIAFLENAGIDYAIDGNVPFTVCKDSKTYGKRDTEPPPKSLGAKDTPERELELLFGGAS